MSDPRSHIEIHRHLYAFVCLSAKIFWRLQPNPFASHVGEALNLTLIREDRLNDLRPEL